MNLRSNLTMLLFACFFMASACLHLHGQSLQWATDFKNADCVGVTSDAAGNTYLLGSLFDTTDFDPGPGQFIVIPQNYSDIFVLKLDASGSIVWLRMVGTPQVDMPKGIDIDPFGNLVVLGEMGAGLDFSNVGVNAPPGEAFLWKIDAAGNTLWVKGFSASNYLKFVDLGIGENGEVYALGEYLGSMDLDPGPGIDTVHTVNNATLLVKLDSSGAYLNGLAFQSTSSSSTRSYELEVDALGVYIACNAYGDSIDADPGPGSHFISNPIPFSENLLVIKISHAGNLIWAKNLAKGSSSGYILGLETDTSGNVYIGGWFNYAIDCDPDPGNAVLISQTGANSNIFMVKWDPNGQFVNAGSLSTDAWMGFRLTSMDVDAQGNIYVHTNIEYQGYMDIDLGNGVRLEGSSTGSGAIVIKYASDFSIRWVGKHQGPYVPGGSWGSLFANDTHLAQDGSLIATGNGFLGTDLDPEDSVQSLTAATYGFGSAFAYRVNCSSASSYSYYSACDSVNIFGQTFTESGLHHFRIPDGQGCDSVVTVQVDVLHPVIAESYGIGRLMTEPIDNAQYQWLDCGNNYAQVPNQNNYYMDVGPVGNYAVAVTIQGCTDTSACYTATLSPVQEAREDLSSFRIATNSEGFRILLPLTFSAMLIDLQGRVLASAEARDEVEFDMGGFPAGVYLVRVQTGKGVASRKVAWMGQ